MAPFRHSSRRTSRPSSVRRRALARLPARHLPWAERKVAVVAARKVRGKLPRPLRAAVRATPQALARGARPARVDIRARAREVPVRTSLPTTPFSRSSLQPASPAGVQFSEAPTFFVAPPAVAPGWLAFLASLPRLGGRGVWPVLLPRLPCRGVRRLFVLRRAFGSLCLAFSFVRCSPPSGPGRRRCGLVSLRVVPWVGRSVLLFRRPSLLVPPAAGRPCWWVACCVPRLRSRLRLFASAPRSRATCFGGPPRAAGLRPVTRSPARRGGCFRFAGPSGALPA